MTSEEGISNRISLVATDFVLCNLWIKKHCDVLHFVYYLCKKNYFFIRLGCQEICVQVLVLLSSLLSKEKSFTSLDHREVLCNI